MQCNVNKLNNDPNMDNNAQIFVKTLPTFTRYYSQEFFKANGEHCTWS